MVEEGEKEGKEENNKEKEKKQLRNILLVLGFFVFMFIGILFLLNQSYNFTYEGIKFDVDSKSLPGTLLYKTSIPLNSEGVFTTGKNIATNYFFYLRNDPRKLERIPYNVEKMNIKDIIIFNFTESFECDKGAIGVVNLGNLMTALGGTVGKNETARCDENGTYTFIQFQRANETSIEQTGVSCYNFNINDCEVLEVTEKFMVEILSRVNEKL